MDLQISVKKACNSEEVPPKRKHVRACIVYTWDHKNSRAFWNAVKIQPLQSSEVQLFKALIMIHKVLQEGHPNTLKDAYRNKDFLYSLSTVFSSSSSYGRLINHYDRFLMRKLDFHRNNQGFNGIFEYEEYISLRSVNDPNEGYESILQLMDLQDLINDLQKLIFSTVHQTPNNLCKVSALVPLISESYGIYKFLTSMLRAMYQQLGNDELLTALFERFNSQHFYLREFYADCQAIKFLTSLITIPKISSTPPNLMQSDEGKSSITSTHDNSLLSAQQTSVYDAPLVPPLVDEVNQTRLFEELRQQQEQLMREQQQLELQRQTQMQDQIRRQQEFERQKRAQEENSFREQEMLRLQQTNAQNSRVSELENDLVMFKSQFDNDQALLQQYDSRVKALETELQSINKTASEQLASKDEQISNIEEQVTNWAKKYEALAKLYSQLRSEHLNLLAKFKKIQQKINSAQESITKKEKFEKELKQKNLELADLIRERDRARLDLDRMRIAKDQEIEKLQTHLREMTSKYVDNDEISSKKVKAIRDKYEGDLLALNELLKEKEDQLLSLGDQSSLREKLKEKEMDLEIAQESLDSALKELSISSQGPSSRLLWSLLNIILANNVRRIQDTKYDLASPMQTGNVNSIPNFLLSILDLCSDTATDFAHVYNNFLAEGPKLSDEEEDENLSFSGVILTSFELATSLNDLMLNIKGLSKTIPSTDEQVIIRLLETLLAKAEDFYLSVTSDSLDALDNDDEKIDLVIDSNVHFQHAVKALSNAVEDIQPRHRVSGKRGNIEDVVDEEMEEAARQIDAAMEFLGRLQMQSSEGTDLQIHQALVAAAMSVTQAVTVLIKASIDSQHEIVAKNKGTQTVREFYKKNNRWTEGLVSAAKAIAGATNILIETADGVLKGNNSHEQLIVACNEVAASTAQLVAASRVKANTMSKTQDRLETSSTKVNTACKSLVGKVQGLLIQESEGQSNLDLSKLTPYEGKTLEMEQQVEILKLENLLQSARKRLADIRKFGYRDDDDSD